MYNEEEFQNFYSDNVTQPQEEHKEAGFVEKKKKPHYRKMVKLAAGVVCAALIACGGYMAGCASAEKANMQVQGAVNSPSENQPNGVSIPGAGVMMPANLVSSSNNSQVYTAAEIAAKYKSAVVAITSKSTKEVYSMFSGTHQKESEGAGSGIIVAKTDTELIIATNNHVVEGTNSLTVCFNDSEEQIYEAYIKGTDASNDLAVVAVKLSDIPKEVQNLITIAVLGNSDECVIGEQVVAIGNALGYGQSLTGGYVSALNRVVTVDGVTYTLIQTDAAINPGNSGGALFNMRGEVIGINSVKFASSQIEGMGYAIPISKAIPILNELAAREKREAVPEEEQGYMGVSLINVTSTTNYYNMPLGIFVNSVEEGSAAEKAGMQNGDIITKFDKMAVSSSSQLKNYLQYYKEGETVEITVERLVNGSYAEKVLNITLGKKPASSVGQDTTNSQGIDEQDEKNDRFDFYDFWNGFGYFPNH